MTSILHACKTWRMWRAFHKNVAPQKLEDIDIVVNICTHGADGEPLTVNELVENSHAARNTVLRHLHALVSRGIVSMKTSLADKRFRELSLTKKGMEVMRRVTASLRQLGAAMARGRKSQAL